MIDYDEIRREAAIAHNVIVAKDDPLLITVTFNELVFQKYVDILLEKQMEHRKALEATQQKGIADAKITAGDVISKAAGYVNEEVRGAIKSAFDEGIERMKAIEKKKEETSRKVPLLDQRAFYWGIIIGGCPFVLYIALQFLSALSR